MSSIGFGGSISATDYLRIDNRQGYQASRREEGVASGQLTNREAALSGRLQAGIEKLETKTYKDEAVTMREAKRMERAQDLSSAILYRLKHNGSEAPQPVSDIPLPPASIDIQA